MKEESPERTVEEADCSGRERGELESGGNSSASETSSVIRIVSDPNEVPSDGQGSQESPETLIFADRQGTSQTLKLEVESQIRLIKETIQQTVPST